MAIIRLTQSMTEQEERETQNSNNAYLANIEATKVTQTTAALTYYVNVSTGSNSNSGLTSGTAFKTIQYAIDSLPKYLAHAVTVNVAAGTYPEDVLVWGFIGKERLAIAGASTLALSTNYKISSFTVKAGSVMTNISGFELTRTTSYGVLVDVNGNASISRCTISASSYTSNGIGSNGTCSISECSVSNRVAAFYSSIHSNMTVSLTSGSGNTTGYYAGQGGFIKEYSNTLTATNLYAKTQSGIIVKSDSTFA